MLLRSYDYSSIYLTFFLFVFSFYVAESMIHDVAKLFKDEVPYTKILARNFNPQREWKRTLLFSTNKNQHLCS